MLKQFFNQQLYIQLSPQRVLVRDPKSGQAIDEVPEIALQRAPSGKLTIVALGQDARGAVAQPDTAVHNPFAHPRSLVSDFTLAEQVLKGFIWRVRGRRLFTMSPVIVMHPLGEHAGGLTQLELRAFRELALGAGAASVRIWLGPPLTDEQLLSGTLPATGRIVSP
ncbi:rod shape-determining protein [Roseateles sp. LYH14W]|uniref:Rod shape-determining protein n=1 Tax=Pelomonas parva TaxID=3299032 RepID=A0ABW7EWZ9_9BURK